jgi:TPP-dependent pyruvate/acetoin dehydrogenase alpha subunit
MLKAVGAAEAKPYPPLGEVFTDVFRAQPWHLQEQRAQLDAHLESYGDECHLSGTYFS